MQQIKIFKGVESDIQGLEDQVNTWISKSGAQIVQITGNIAAQTLSAGTAPAKGLSQGSFAPSDVMLVVLYERG